MAKKQQHSQPFWVGGAAAALAACFTHPLDQTKYRMQVQSTKQPMLRALYGFASRDGVLSLWSGISASILRQCAYSTMRFGLYNHLSSRAKISSGTNKLSTASTIACAGLAGGIAGMVGNPTEVVLVRMCADGAKVPAQTFAYSNAFDGLIRIAREEGLRTFSKGLGPNIARSVLMNVSQIAVYTQAKSQLLSNPWFKFQDNPKTHILASLAAGTVATTVCAPADVLKSRMQSASTANGKTPGLFRVISESLKKDGPAFFMRGWTPAWLRLAPNTILTFVFMEQLLRLIERVPSVGVMPKTQRLRQ